MKEPAKDPTSLPWRMLDNVQALIRAADTKATGLLAAEGVVGGIVLTHLTEILEPLRGDFWAWRFAAVAAICFLTSFFSALYVLLPRLRFPTCCGKLDDFKSFIFFGSVAKDTRAGYYKKMTSLVNDTGLAVEHISQQVWVNSGIADRKFSLLIRAIRFFGVAVLLALIALAQVHVV